ncbi:MAG TPA: hypothetical protein VNQ79_20450 [Blastocatellia bacterium]|nr:hypothetical protein [Blastocatellia bacterium]
MKTNDSAFTLAAGGEPNISSFYETGLGAEATDSGGDVSASITVPIEIRQQ